MTLVDALMDAQALNAAQDRALFNDTPEADSALEHAHFLLRTANDSQRPHAAALVRLLGEIRSANQRERVMERVAAGMADPVRNVHDYCNTVRPLLADLMNPACHKRHGQLVDDLREVFARTRPGSRRSISVRHLLGVRKFTRLVDELEEWLQVQPEVLL